MLLLAVELNSNATLNRLAAETEGLNSFKIEDFTYRNSIVKDIMFKYLSRTSFIGVTVSVATCTLYCYNVTLVELK